MRYARISLLSAAAACAMAIATPALGQVTSVGAPAYSNSATSNSATGAPNDDVEKIEKDNQLLSMPASHDDIAGAGQVQSQEDVLTKRIEQDDPRLDSEITDICPTCGGAEYAPAQQRPSPIYNGLNRPHTRDAPVHQRLSPIYNGFNHQPTEDQLRALHQQDVTRDQAQETDQLYDQLMSTSNQILRQRPAVIP
jgi:hypothetical protein